MVLPDLESNPRPSPHTDLIPMMQANGDEPNIQRSGIYLRFVHR